MNEIIGYYTINGIKCNINECNYICIKLLGNNADTNNSNILISKDHLPLILDYKWYLGKSGYPVTYSSIDNKQKFGKGITLHKLLFPLLMKGYVVDHINRDKLDNRKENLRICTAKENSYNRTRSANKKYKGVFKCGDKWTARITKDGKLHTINNIGTEKDAAKMYDMMAEDLFGVYAGKNFMN